MAKVRSTGRARGGGQPRPRKVGDWAKARAVLPGFDHFYRQAEIQSVRKEAEHFVRMVNRAFKTSGKSNRVTWAPNSNFTKRMKRSSKPLIDTGDLKKSVRMIPAGPGMFFAGVPNNARGKNGKSLIPIGKIHEFGKVIVMRITQKQHRFFMAKLKEMGMGGARGGGGGGGFRPGSTLVIRIPKRSFLVSTKEAHFDDLKSQRRIKRRISEDMRKKVGTLRSQPGVK